MNSDQIVDILKADIISGVLPPRIKILPEKELAEKFGVSIMTIRKAIEKLKTQEILRTVERSGTYVNFIEDSFNCLDQFLRSYQMSAILKEMYASESVVNVRSFVNEDIEFVPKGMECVEIKKIRFLNGYPSAVEYSYIPQEFGEYVEFIENFVSYNDYLENTKKFVLSRSKVSLEAIIPDPKLVNALRLEEGEGVFVIKQITSKKSNEFLEYSVCYQAGSRINI